MLLSFYFQNRRSMKQCGYRRITKRNELVNLKEEREFLKRTFKLLDSKIGRYEGEK